MEEYPDSLSPGASTRSSEILDLRRYRTIGALHGARIDARVRRGRAPRRITFSAYRTEYGKVSQGCHRDVEKVSLRFSIEVFHRDELAVFQAFWRASRRMERQRKYF